jgi:hypothetical protein
MVDLANGPETSDMPSRASGSRQHRWLDSIGAACGVVALIISGLQAWYQIRRAPDTVATNEGSALQIDYDPVQKSLAFTFPALLQNNGTSDDFLEGASATLQVSGGAQQKMISGMSLGSDSKTSIEFPYPLPIGSHLLSVSARSDLNDASTLVGGSNRIDLTLTAANQSQHKLQYCFDLNADLVADMLHSQRLWHRQISPVACAQPASKGASS